MTDADSVNEKRRNGTKNGQEKVTGKLWKSGKNEIILRVNKFGFEILAKVVNG